MSGGSFRVEQGLLRGEVRWEITEASEPLECEVCD